jgi:hypothetical protein
MYLRDLRLAIRKTGQPLRGILQRHRIHRYDAEWALHYAKTCIAFSVVSLNRSVAYLHQPQKIRRANKGGEEPRGDFVGKEDVVAEPVRREHAGAA